MNKGCLAMTQHQRELLHTPALEAAVPFQCRLFTGMQCLAAQLGSFWDPGYLLAQSFTSLCQPVRASLGVSDAAPQTWCKHIPITYLWHLSAYVFSKALQKPLHKHNQNITCRRGKLFHWEVIFKKRTNHRYLWVHCLHANLGWKWRTSIYNCPREIQWTYIQSAMFI